MGYAGWFVDLLPRRLWKPGNLFMPFGHSLHFCSGPSVQHAVRTIEWDGQEIARGRHEFRAPPEEPTWLWRIVVPRVVDGLPARLWTPPGRASFGGRLVFEHEETDEPGGPVRVINVFGRPGFLTGRIRQGD